MALARLTNRESLRDIDTRLRAIQPKLFHAGIRGKVSRSTLARANKRRDWRIYADLTQVLISTARKLYVDEKPSVELERTACALDSTTIDLTFLCFREAGDEAWDRASESRMDILRDSSRGDAPLTVAHNGAPWEQGQKMVKSDGRIGNGFASTVAVSGHRAAVDAINGDGHATDPGATYVFDVTTGRQLFKLLACDDNDTGSASGFAYVFDLSSGRQMSRFRAGSAR